MGSAEAPQLFSGMITILGRDSQGWETVRGTNPVVLTGREQLQCLPPERNLTLTGIGETVQGLCRGNHFALLLPKKVSGKPLEISKRKHNNRNYQNNTEAGKAVKM